MSSSSSSRSVVSASRGPISCFSQLRNPCNGFSATAPLARLAAGASAMGRLAHAIGIGHVEVLQNRHLERFHALGLGRVLVIPTEKMQHAVHDEMTEMMRERFLLRLGLACHRLEGDDDVAQEMR